MLTYFLIFIQLYAEKPLNLLGIASLVHVEYFDGLEEFNSQCEKRKSMLKFSRMALQPKIPC
jgi:hypothetical protein